MNMNWHYLAGFFDGEGSIESLMRNNRIPKIEIGQSRARGLYLLQEISAFLQSYGIASAVKPKVNRTASLGKLPMYVLCIQKDALVFLRHVLPYVRIKRSEAQDVLRFRTMYPPKENRWWRARRTWAPPSKSAQKGAQKC